MVTYYVDDKREGAAKYYDEDGNEEDKFYKDGELVDDSYNFEDSEDSED